MRDVFKSLSFNKYKYELLILLLCFCFSAAGCKHYPITDSTVDDDNNSISESVTDSITDSITPPTIDTITNTPDDLSEQPIISFEINAEEPDLREITRGDITCTINNSTGLVIKAASSDASLDFDGIYIDVGYNEEYPFQQLGYTSFEDANTWELPMVWARKKSLPDNTITVIEETEQGFTISMSIDSLTVIYEYEINGQVLKLNAKIKTSETKNQLINGVAFIIKGIDNFPKETSTFEFPGSTPGGIISLAKYNKYSVTISDYACPVLLFRNDEYYQNIIFVNEHEKWSTGAFSNEYNKACAIFLSATESFLKAGEELIVGNLYIPLISKENDPYLSVQDFWEELGYHTPKDSVNDGPVYSCHPYGTMDTNYFNRLSLTEYAEQLESIKAMGFKNIWLLPIFYHTSDNVYEPIDQGVIDARYGGIDGALYFINKAHDLNLRVLFDLVPHGPRPVYSFAKEHDDWVSKDKEGNNQIEWECVSFDYNNPAYYNYTVNLLSYYAREFKLDGARIDCAMGGLSNWFPVNGLRASSSGLKGGVNITAAVKEGFLSGGVTPILLPENFHPIPYYAEYTDVFYDMPLFRMMFSLNYLDISEAEYVSRLLHWLDAERKTSVKGQVKLRFLGNHDTVTWTFDAKRAQAVYGTEKAKALWSILSFIDGVPFIYQGDEDPETYNLPGENLTTFFTDMLAARSNYFPMDYEIMYIDTNSPIFAFTRYSTYEADIKLVLVNLSESSNTFSDAMAQDEVLYHLGGYNIIGEEITLEPYASIIIQAK